ncbi:NADP-dependent oxidoreductase domain-containing protein 1 [Echeneis naucrates]|uniref:NADP-dependent oxidoreductase domain-containing protein 1 n=1 Tax=Echeneis naucrates TaxID=173247 RepID=UPI001113407B|nr:NADP-dependent oxidoreductase domain-containing protein 1 [Echeneis naucrates]
MDAAGELQDVAAGLSGLSFGSGLTGEEEKLRPLRARAAGLTFCGLAHALYLCKLAHSLRYLALGASSIGPAQPGGDALCVGILGLGRTGKQLLLSLLDMTAIKASHIKVSTRRPQNAVEFLQNRVECFFDNGRLAAWADLLFLCCLPSHLPKVCADLHSRLSKHCLVYSFISAVPVARLTKLLRHDFIIKPQYDIVGGATADVWLSCTDLSMALREPLLIEASCPLTMSGGITLNLNWVCTVLYSLLNICTSASLPSSEALSLMNSLFMGKRTHTVQLNAQSFISSFHASSLGGDEPFPWISLTDAQSKETPLLRFLSSNKSMQQRISEAYKSLLETPVSSDSYTLL